MVNSEGISLSISDGFEPKPASRSSSGDSPDGRSPSDLDIINELIDEFGNVGFREVAKEQSGATISVPESNGGVDSKAVVGNQEEEEGRDASGDGDGDGDGGNESESENKAEEREDEYPVRPWAEDCAFYMRTGSCKFGSGCKFNHPFPNPRKSQVTSLPHLLCICLRSSLVPNSCTLFF